MSSSGPASSVSLPRLPMRRSSLSRPNRTSVLSMCCLAVTPGGWMNGLAALSLSRPTLDVLGRGPRQDDAGGAGGQADDEGAGAHDRGGEGRGAVAGRVLAGDGLLTHGGCLSWRVRMRCPDATNPEPQPHGERTSDRARGASDAVVTRVTARAGRAHDGPWPNPRKLGWWVVTSRWARFTPRWRAPPTAARQRSWWRASSGSARPGWCGSSSPRRRSRSSRAPRYPSSASRCRTPP